MYNGYGMQYGPQYYGVPHQYQNGVMPAPGYPPYQNYARSPPAMHHQFAPMVGVSVPHSYPHQSQPSPALATPYQPPPAPIPPHTPSSTHSSQMPPPPTPPTPQRLDTVPVSVLPVTVPAPVSAPASEAAPEPTPAPVPATPSAPVSDFEPEPEQESTYLPFRPPLPWLSRPDVEFPKRSKLRRRKKLLSKDHEGVSLPTEQQGVTAETKETAAAVEKPALTEVEPAPSQDAAPESPAPSGASKTSPASARAATVAVPVVPALPKPTPKTPGAEPIQNDESSTKVNGTSTSDAPSVEEKALADDATAAQEAKAPAKAPPSSWANLFSKPSAAATVTIANPNGTAAVEASTNGGGSPDVSIGQFPSAAQSKASALAEVIRSFTVGSIDKVPFLEPRGLINTGNMCYMNSVLQVLVFCLPFHRFLDQVSKRAAHSFKSDTPLIDAMIMFMHEYRVIKSASSTDQLQSSLKAEDLEKYGEPFTPEFVYEAIRQLSRFASMRRGHQQDAEEFLGFLLQSLDDECIHVMNTAGATLPSSSTASEAGDTSAPAGDWLEVGRKQRAAITRSSGSNSSTPITKIFGGLLRSEFRVPGLKDSITTEPYQPLQLDIGSPDVHNVVDALRGLTRPERLQGDFNSPRGKDVTATKQVFIETLPPVLILHLKRFQFDAEGNGTVKIWKKIDYPLELEIPREALSGQKSRALDGGMPKYKLISVVYHHGKNASGGHYTVDVRRQDGQEWIRIDDTVIRRVRSQDVAEVGAEEEQKDARRKQNNTGTSGNRFGAMNDEDTGDEGGWKQVTTSANGNKRWSNVVNGAPNGAAKQHKESIRDNKVAYLLFYQRV
ncbi:hypothetical protein B0I35DRAFT_474590 [Stachybotrys elegans]|uniref:Ubiquitin carboxyl-terminal hydrolase n=1 Tax=Stachybotrys elegans TaxID=80388 RepID=A0A8K0T0U0_9HYPO|nr:hypothetical protein B0I35DRAFT_474590 [Stachybotrys elegans]